MRTQTSENVKTADKNRMEIGDKIIHTRDRRFITAGVVVYYPQVVMNRSVFFLPEGGSAII